MRISVTDRCNLRCTYCMPETGVQNIGHEQILGFEDIEKVVRAACNLGFDKFRLTGGEPLVRRGILSLVEKIAAVPGVKDLAMTTNGVLLAEMAAQLKSAGLNRINISVDTLDPEKFKTITRGGELSDVLAGIEAAEEAGLTPIRINAVAMRGFNDDEILKFAKLTDNHPYDIRFIELMPIGNADSRGSYISTGEIAEMLHGYEPIYDKSGVAEYYKKSGAQGRIGLISPLSNHFCGDCNKVRLTPDGKLKPCLHSDREIDIKPALASGEDALMDLLSEVVAGKEERHYINDGAAPIKRDMNKIGG